MITFCSSIILPVVVLFPQKLDSPLFLNEIYDNSFFELFTLPEKLSSNPPPFSFRSLSALLRFTASDYPLVIFKLFFHTEVTST
jgi:hypothetical protein